MFSVAQARHQARSWRQKYSNQTAVCLCTKGKGGLRLPGTGSTLPRKPLSPIRFNLRAAGTDRRCADTVATASPNSKSFISSGGQQDR
jgi:hypothetical protein